METIVSTFLWKRTRVPIFKKFVRFFVKILYVPQRHCYAMTTEDDDEGSNALETRGSYISNGVD